VLSRIAEALYQTGREVERAQNVVRVLEVQHKMALARGSPGPGAGWMPIFEAFVVEEAEEPTEEALYAVLVLDRDHPYSVRGRIGAARERARTLRECISEEMWEHLNRFHLELAPLGFADIRRIGRSEFNRRVELFCDAFHGLADDTMIHGPEWHFLRLGKFLERAAMLCRILDIKRKTLELTPEQEGRPIDFHHWQGMLRSVSGYEPYRRVYDARIVPARVLDFVLSHPDFPRSFRHCLVRIEESLGFVASDAWRQRDLLAEVRKTLTELSAEPGDALLQGGLEAHVRALSRRCTLIAEGLEGAFFRSRRPLPRASVVGPVATLRGQVQQ
jgi:uncharacterized alpha-E superfamily protein